MMRIQTARRLEPAALPCDPNVMPKLNNKKLNVLPSSLAVPQQPLLLPLMLGLVRTRSAPFQKGGKENQMLVLEVVPRAPTPHQSLTSLHTWPKTSTKPRVTSATPRKSCPISCATSLAKWTTTSLFRIPNSIAESRR